MSETCCGPNRDQGASVAPRETGASPQVDEHLGDQVHIGARSSNSLAIEFAEIPAGVFLMGNSRGDGYEADGESAVHEVSVNAFSIGATVITNAQFAAFVCDWDFSCGCVVRLGLVVCYLSLCSSICVCL